MDTPTSENTTSDDDDAPAETEGQSKRIFRVDVSNLTPVREHDDVRELLGVISFECQHHAHRHPDDTMSATIAAILTATDTAYCEASHEDDRGKRARAFLDKVEGLAGSAEHYMREANRGPRTRDQEADMLRNRIARDIDGGATPRQIAEHVVSRVRIAPTLAALTCVPVAGAWVGTGAETDAVSLVESAIERRCQGARKPDPEAYVRAALRALGYPKAKNLFAHRDK